MIQVCARRACVRVFVRAGEDDESAISARRGDGLCGSRLSLALAETTTDEACWMLYIGASKVGSLPKRLH